MKSSVKFKVKNTTRKKADAEIRDLPVFKERECCYCGEKFQSQLMIKEYPFGTTILQCRADCGRIGKHALSGEDVNPKFEKIKVLGCD